MTASSRHRHLRLEDAVRIARTWRAAGGNPVVDLGAREPMLWRDGEKRIEHLIAALRAIGMKVTMTTNGSLLKGRVAALQRAGLGKLRVSWHTTQPRTFRAMSGGRGQYARFLEGLTEAAMSEIPIAINRLVLKDTVVDLADQLAFVQKHRLTIKLYDLMWTPELGPAYALHYQPLEPVVRDVVAPRAKSVERHAAAAGRTRTRYALPQGGVVEVKESGDLERNEEPCRSCHHRSHCLEAFDDYTRVDTDLRCYTCYLRSDLGFDLRPVLRDVNSARRLSHALEALGRGPASRLLQGCALRLTVTRRCNFACQIPGVAASSWCLESRLVNGNAGKDHCVANQCPSQANELTGGPS